MKIGDARVVLRPRSIAEIFELALRWQATHAGALYLRLGALCLLPCFALCLWSRYLGEEDWGYIWMMAMVMALGLQGIFTVANSLLFFDEDVTVRKVFAHLRRRLGPHIGTLLWCAVLLIGTGLTVFLLPLFCVAAIFTYEASLLEGQGVFEAVRRSGRMVRGMVAHSLGLCMGLSAAAVTFVIVSEVLGQGFIQLLDLPPVFGNLFEDGGSMMALMGLFASIPFITGARFLTYIDNRTRRDGWDVQVRLMALAASIDRREGV